MLAPQACVAIEIAGSPAAQEQRAALEQRCSEILGLRRCRIVASGGDDMNAACWQARVSTEGGDGDTPTAASVVLSDGTEPQHPPVRRDVTFRPNDAVAERWTTLGLVIAALVTVEEHSAAEAAPAAPPGQAEGGFSPVIGTGGAPAVPRVPLEGELRASGVAAIGVLPQAALGARLEASLARGHLQFLVRGTAFPEGARASLDANGAGGQIDLWSAGLGFCGVGADGRWGLRACAGGDVARMSAHGVGVAETSSALAWWGWLWTGASAELRVARHLALTLDVEAALLLRRPTFAIEGVSTVFTPSPVGGALALGVAVPF
jgi:hypothetical protein